MAGKKKPTEVEMESTTDGKIRLTPKRKTTTKKTAKKKDEVDESTDVTSGIKELAVELLDIEESEKPAEAPKKRGRKSTKSTTTKTTAKKRTTSRSKKTTKDVEEKPIEPQTDNTELTKDDVKDEPKEAPKVEPEAIASKTVEDDTTTATENNIADVDIAVITSTIIDPNGSTEELSVEGMPGIMVEVIENPSDIVKREEGDAEPREHKSIDEIHAESIARRERRRLRRQHRLEQEAQEAAKREEEKKHAAENNQVTSEPPRVEVPEVRHDELPEDLKNLESSSYHTKDGRVMFPLNGSGTPPMPASNNAASGNKSYGDPNAYIYLEVTPSSNSMNADMLEFALADNSGRTLYVQLDDISLKSITPQIFIDVAQHLPKNIPPEVVESRQDWMVCTDKANAKRILVKWLEPFMERHNHIQVVTDGNCFGFILFMNFLTGEDLEKIPTSFSPYMLDLNNVIALHNGTMTIKSDNANGEFDFIPVLNASKIDRLELALALGMKKEDVKDATIDVIYKVLLMSDLHRLLSNNWQRF